jgi:hypothetical protein
MKKKNLWSTILEYVSDKELNDTITRQELLALNEKCKIRNSITSVDTYRMLLARIGVLETEKLGIYKKVKNIRKDLSLSLVREMAYKDTWKSWFMQID